MIIREACVGNFIEAINAENFGAERIELCENLYEGGTTPSYGTVKKVLEKIKIPILVMIRSRGGNFCYSPSEVEIMIEDIRLFKKLGEKDIFLGVLTPKNKIDYPLLKRFLNETGNMEVTFHKAIDEVVNLSNEVENLAKLGIDRILTSGGVTMENFEEVKLKIPSTEFHGKKIVGSLT